MTRAHTIHWTMAAASNIGKSTVIARGKDYGPWDSYLLKVFFKYQYSTVYLLGLWVSSLLWPGGLNEYSRSWTHCNWGHLLSLPSLLLSNNHLCTFSNYSDLFKVVYVWLLHSWPTSHLLLPEVKLPRMQTITNTFHLQIVTIICIKSAPKVHIL